MRLFLLLFFIHTAIIGVGQERCHTVSYLSQTNTANEKKGIDAAAAFQKNATSFRVVYEDAIIRIPVVVHVLYNNASQNISDAQVKSGLEALNRDFRRKNADTTNTPIQFRHLAADVQIEFYLAKTDARGNATTGITRKQTTRNGWMPDDKMKLATQGGVDAWSSKDYLNIWICNLIGGSGYASVPGSAAATDGVVINYSAFGTINTVAPFNLGRTAVHEVGHWLGLKHIWGESQCGDDGVFDTPQQGYFTKGCPSGFRSSCNNDPAGDMYMNYMDYTNDDCMNLFTQGQRQRMRAAFAEGGPRASLLDSKGLNEPGLAESPLPVTKMVSALFPNPAADKITVQVNAGIIGKTLTIYNSQGQAQRSVPVQTEQQAISVATLAPGVYFIKGEGYLQRFVKL